MIIAKIFIFIVAFACVICEEKSVWNIPIIGPALDTLANASEGVLNGAIDTVERAGHEVYGIVDNMRNLLETFRKQMTQGIIELGLPALEPLLIEHVDIDITHEIGIFKGTLDKVKIEKLSTFEARDIQVAPFKYNVKLNLTYDALDITGIYNLTANIADLFVLHGNGPFTINIYDIFITVDAKLLFKNKAFTVDYIHLLFHFKSLKCNFENLMNGGANGELFNKVIGELAPEAVDNLWPEIEPILSKHLKQVGSEKLEKIPYQTILAILFGQSKLHN